MLILKRSNSAVQFISPVPACNSVCGLQPPDTETAQELEEEVNKTPEPKPWISLGSEIEIEEESVKETREKVLR